MAYRKTLLHWVSLLFLVSVLALASTPIAYGQATTGTISGTVMDQTGAVIPGATVTVRNLDTNISQKVTTGSDGRFNLPALPVGRYELTAEMTGFSKYVRGPINLVLNQEAVINPELRPATVEATIMVSEDAPMLNTVNAEVGVRFDERRLTDLPNLPPGGRFDAGGFRDVFAYALSAPGVSQLNSGNSAFAAGTNFSVNGMRPRGNNFMIDGQDSNDPSVTGRQQVMNNPDAVKEFRLITNQFAAEYGRAAGSVVNVITKSGTNSFHGSAFWFHNDNALNSRSNLDKSAGFRSAPFRIENQIGGTVGGPIWKDHTFFFGSIQRWTDRGLGSGTTITGGVPTEAGRQILQQQFGSRPQVAALLRFLPAAQTAAVTTVNVTSGTQTFAIPLGSLTNFTSQVFNDWQWSLRMDHNWTKHRMGGRYLWNGNQSSGTGQATPPGLSQVNVARQQAMTLWLTSNLTTRLLNEGRLSYQRLGTNTSATDPSSESIPSIEINQLGLTGFNAASSRTAIGLAVNLPQFRFNNTIQIQDTMSWTRGRHELKWGFDFRRIDVKSFFFPTIRGLLQYSTLQNFVDDIAQAARINIPLPGTSRIQYYNWWDYFFFFQDEWRVHPTLTLNLGLRYETPGNAIESQYDENDRVVARLGPVFRLFPRPSRDKNNWQPRFGFSWNPRTQMGGPIHWLTGGNKLVVRGGYSRTNDYAFINLALNVVTAFPYVLVADATPPVQNSFSTLQTLQPNLSDPATINRTNARTVMGEDFRSPVAEQFALEIQREMTPNTVLRVGYVGTKGTALFETIDGNPRTQCSPIPTTSTGTVTGCPRVDPTLAAVRLRANAASSIYHSLQVSVDRRWSKGFSAGAHYTWSSFIDEASDTFNASAAGEVAVAQNSFNRRPDRGRSTYDRPQRFAANFVWELPWMKNQPSVIGHILGGWQFASFFTLQAGSPFTPLNGVDPTLAQNGIDGFVGNSIRPNLNTTLNLSGMTVEEIRRAGAFTGGRWNLFNLLASCQRITGTNTCNPVERFGNVGRSVLRSDGIANWDFSVLKRTRITESHALEFRMDFFNSTNTRNFGIPQARVNNAGFANQWATDGGNRRIFFSLRYVF